MMKILQVIIHGERMKVRYSKTSQLGIIDDDYEEEEEDVELPES